jgi:Domain of unknown function (DUF4410)
MELPRSFTAVALIASYALAFPSPEPAKSPPTFRQPQSAGASPARSTAVYVSDFELDVFRGRVESASRSGTSQNTASNQVAGTAAGTRASTAASTPLGATTSSRARPPDSQKEATPAEQADTLVTTMAENLVSALEKAGYKVQRLRSASPLPTVGIRLRGVFAEADERNRVRRLLVGSNATALRMLLYVGINNLARPEQPLYELANPPANDRGHGPVITITSYSPAARFEMTRNPEDEDFRKIATEIVADLNALLNANPMAAAQ